MIPIIAPVAAVAVEAIGGFAAAAAAAVTPEVLIAGIGGAAAVAKIAIAEEAAVQTAALAVAGEVAVEEAAIQAARTVATEQIAAQAARTSFGAAIAPWVGGVLLAGTVLYGAYKIIKYLKDKKEVAGQGRPITQEEFLKTLNNQDIINAIRQNLKENSRQYHMTEYQLYLSTLDTIRGNPAYKNISDDDKINLATRLTKGLI